MSFYNFYKQLLENNKYLKNYTLVFIQMNNKDLQHWSTLRYLYALQSQMCISYFSYHK